MARGVARSIDDRIADLNAKIQKKQDEIAALKEQRKELEEAKKSETAAKIAKLAEEKGIGLDELLNMVQSK